jgi:hypothetical protein
MIEPSELSPEARVALINAHFRQGSSLPTGTEPAVAIELFQALLVSPRGTLTGRGAIVRARCVDYALEQMERGEFEGGQR